MSSSLAYIYISEQNLCLKGFCSSVLDKNTNNNSEHYIVYEKVILKNIIFILLLDGSRGCHTDLK